MKRILLTGMLFLGMGANAQLAAGSTAPDFTLTDINGVSHHLYSYLDAGKTVFIDVSATWCDPCFQYHGTHALENLWVAHGPTGGTNVSSSTSNDVIVLFIEGDGTTDNADLHGTGTNTLGDWVTGVSHPIIDPATAEIDAFNTDYAIGYFPTVYKICPNRQVTEVGTVDAAALYATVAECPTASGANNPGLTAYVGETSSCAAIDVTVTLQNLGTNPLTSATIDLKQGSTVLNTFNWTGNLATYATENVIVGQVTPNSPTTYTIEITSTDDVTTNNTITQLLSNAPVAATSDVTILITTDQYGSDTQWELLNEAGTAVASGGPYTDQSAAGAYPQTPVTYTAPTADECYTLSITDVYGDGLDAGYGTGSYSVTDGNGNELVSYVPFTTAVTGKFKSGSGGSTGSIKELDETSYKIFPNPVSDKLTITFEAANLNYTIDLLDLTGRVIITNEYLNLNGSQEISIPVTGVSPGNYMIKISTETIFINKKVSIK